MSQPPVRPSYPKLKDFRSRPMLASVGAAALGLAGLSGCGMDLEDLLKEQLVAAHQPADAGADAGPDPSDFYAGGMPAPDLDGGTPSP